MAFDDLDINHRFNQAVRDTAQRIPFRNSAYEAAAYSGVVKPGYNNYALDLQQVLQQDGRVVLFSNQQTGAQTMNTNVAAGWLLPGRQAFWVHCFSGQMPNPAAYRVYVCADLAYAGYLLQRLLHYYQGSLYFKIADHDEARLRNDTFVSWHATLQEARLWCNIARQFPGALLGSAPAGTFGGIDVEGVGIDVEENGQTSTNRIAERAQVLAERRNPYI